MTLMLAGMLLFFGTHLVPWSPRLREAARAAVGDSRYRGLFAFGAFVGLVLMVLGYGDMPRLPLYQPPGWGRWLALPMLFLAFVLLPAAHMRSNVKRYTRHPMLWGVILWAGAHLLVRGELRSTLLFGSFVLYSLLAIGSADRRGAQFSTIHYPVAKDLAVLGAGTVAFAAMLLLHPLLFGVAIIRP